MISSNNQPNDLIKNENFQKNLIFEKVLKNDTENMEITLLCHLKDNFDEKAIAKFSKIEFIEEVFN